jgi:uncharacterized membrane protein YidH (DUF202 family)
MRTGELHVRPRRFKGEHGVRPYGLGRLAMLYLVSRRFPQTLVAIAALTFLVWWAMRQTPTSPISGLDIEQVTARNETLLLHLAAALLASVIGLAVFTPFGETERVSPVVLPVMRALHLLLLLVVGCVAIGIVIAGWRQVVPGADLMPLFVRNTLCLTGVLLLAGNVIDVRLAWMLPVVLGGVTITTLLQEMRGMMALEEMWRHSGWNILALDLSYGWATAICLGVGIGAIAVYIRDGVRDSAEGE